MGLIADDDLERVRAASDLVQIASESVTLKRAGRKYKACCPFHQEKTPSFQIDPELNLWHCFGCGQGGDVFDFVMRIRNLDFPEAVRLLADRAHIELKETGNDTGRPRGQRERLKACCAEAEAFYHTQLMRSKDATAQAAREYLGARGMGSDVCKRWNLGYAPGHGRLVAHLQSKGFTDDEIITANLALKSDRGRVNDRFFDRVMFPIHDKLGATIAFGGRVIGKTPPNTGKYINSSETPIFHKSSNMFGIDRAKDAITANATVVVVEGYTDVIAMHEAGIKYCVATLGTALTQQHVKMLRSLRPRKIIYLFDGDEAGQKAADRAMEFIDWGIAPESGMDYLEFLVTVLPGGQDPAEFVAAEGATGMEKALAEAQPLIRFAIDRRLGQWDLHVPEQRGNALASAVSLLAPIKGSIIAEDYCNYIADRLGCSQATVARALAGAQVKQGRGEIPRVDEGTTSSGPRGAGSNAPVPAPSPSATESPRARAERELLTLVAAYPQAISLLSREREKVEWSNAMSSRVAAAFIDTYVAGMTASALVTAVDAKVEGTAKYLSAGTIEVNDKDSVEGVVMTLIYDLREMSLKEAIRSGNAKLKNPAELTPEEYDMTFREIAELQKEMNRLREDRNTL